MNTLKLFGKRLKEIRKNKNITQEQLAEQIGIEPKQICRIENGTCFTTFEKLQKIAQTLDVEVYEFFRFEHKKPKDALIKEMNELFINAPDEKIEIIYRIVTTLLI